VDEYETEAREDGSEVWDEERVESRPSFESEMVETREDDAWGVVQPQILHFKERQGLRE
jgi:hypothetical protein